jgi:LPXTG-site transpeptidase (sortase) family protein
VRYRAYIAGLIATSVVIVASVLVLVLRGEDGTASEEPRVADGPERVAVEVSPAAARTTEAIPEGAERSTKPVRVVIPAIDVAAPVVRLGLERDGTLEVPKSFSDAGWWSGGFRPGQSGPAVIVGHVDSTRGPAVFVNLRELKPGDAVVVFGADGSTIQFEVDRLEEVGKDEFPTKRVYSETLHATLRLITCGGQFDPSERSYEDNVIVYASRV